MDTVTFDTTFKLYPWANYVGYQGTSSDITPTSTIYENSIQNSTSLNYTPIVEGINPWTIKYEIQNTLTPLRYDSGTCASALYFPYSTVTNLTAWGDEVGGLTYRGGMTNDWIQVECPRDRFKKNLNIQVKSRANLSQNISEPESRAMETLREMITEREFRKYLRYGFILVKSKSGKTFQVFRNRSHTKVWEGGKLVEEICVRIKDSKIPPTDNVIAFKVAIEADEDAFVSMGNRYNYRQAA